MSCIRMSRLIDGQEADELSATRARLDRDVGDRLIGGELPWRGLSLCFLEIRLNSARAKSAPAISRRKESLPARGGGERIEREFA